MVSTAFPDSIKPMWFHSIPFFVHTPQREREDQTMAQNVNFTGGGRELNMCQKRKRIYYMWILFNDHIYYIKLLLCKFPMRMVSNLLNILPGPFNSLAHIDKHCILPFLGSGRHKSSTVKSQKLRTLETQRDDTEGWDGEGGGRGVQDGEHM